MDTDSRRSLVARAIGAKKVVICAACALIVALVIWVCISTGNARNMRNDYAAARNSVGGILHGCLFNMQHEYERASYAGADVENEILPKMQDFYVQACAVDDAIDMAFGNEFSVLQPALRQQIEQAFAAYDAAHAAGKSTADADALMREAMAAVNARLNVMYDVEGRLLSD